MRRKSLSFAKTTRPNYSGIFPRKRLFSLLDKGRKRRILWISGPPGSGKTVLASSYMDSRKLPCLWYQVDSGDSDVASFFYYMGLAAKKAAPRRKKPLPLLTPEYIPGLPVFTRRYFEVLFSRLKTPSCIVFDNYHDAPAESSFHERTMKLLNTTPKAMTR